MNNSEKYIGYIKYSGKSVEDWLLDVRKSAEALLGFDEILRYFLLKEDPSLSEIDFEIPVRIRRGSWEALIPETIENWIMVGAATTYITAMAKKAATDGLFETGIAKDVKKTFQIALTSIQWIIKIATHMGGFIKNKFENAKIIQEDQKVYIEILNQEGKSIRVPKKYADLFINCPENIFAKNAKIIETERVLEFGVFDQDKETKVLVSEKEKYIFYNQDEDDDIVLPELEHGQFIELEGEITRATESTNSIGFRYQNHTLVCKPMSGNIAQYKNKIISSEDDQFFPKVQIKGQVDRTDKNGGFKEKKPQILFSEVLPLVLEKHQTSLF